MQHITLTPEERKELRAMARATKDIKVAIRIRTILALDKGWSCASVAEILLLDEDTVTAWKYKFEQRKSLTDWLISEYVPYDGKLTKEEQAKVEEFVMREIISDARVVVEFIASHFGKEYTLTGVTKLLHRLEFVYKHTTLIPGKLNEEAQAKFVDEYHELAATLPADEVILFGDGVHPSHNVHATQAWIKKGEQKQIPTNTGRKRMNINGALNVDAMRAVTHSSKTINAEETIHLLDKIQETYPEKKAIHFIVDNARYYKNKDVQAYLDAPGCRIKFIFLPPYSPNLNFIERLWHYLKKYIIGSKRRDTFKEFERDVGNFFEHMEDHEDKLRQFIGTEMHLIHVQS